MKMQVKTFSLEWFQKYEFFFAEHMALFIVNKVRNLRCSTKEKIYISETIQVTEFYLKF